MSLLFDDLPCPVLLEFRYFTIFYIPRHWKDVWPLNGYYASKGYQIVHILFCCIHDYCSNCNIFSGKLGFIRHILGNSIRSNKQKWTSLPRSEKIKYFKFISNLMTKEWLLFEFQYLFCYKITIHSSIHFY